MSQKYLPSFLVVFVLLNVCYGEDKGRFTLEECIQQALNNNPVSAIARATEEGADRDVSAAKGRFYPEVGFQTGVRRFETHAFLPTGIGGPGFPSHIGPITDYQLNLRAGYTLFDSGLRSADLQIAQAQLSAAQHEFSRTRDDLVFRVHVAFYEILQATDAVHLAGSRLARSKDHLRIAEDRKAAGAVPQADVTRSRTEVSSVELQVAAAESSLRIAEGRLNELMGRSAATSIHIARPDLQPMDPEQIRIAEVLEQAVQNRPEIKSAQQRAEAKRSQIAAVRSEILPRVRAETGYGWRDDDFEAIDKDWWVGITLNIPLFDGGVRGHRIAKSRIEADRELQQVAQIKLAVQQEAWTAYSQWIEAWQALQSSNVMKSEAAETALLFKARYEEGAGTINDLLDAEFAFNQAETQWNNARYRLHMAHAAFLRATGQQIMKQL